MKNRLRMHWRVVLGFCIFFIGTALPGVDAQPGFFNFTYPGPNTIPVNPANQCSNTLAGNMGTPVVSSPFGFTITTSNFDAAQSQFQLGDAWNIGETAHVYWMVADNMGHSATFEFFVAFTDTTAPVLNTAGVQPLLQYNSIREVPTAPVLTATDACPPTPTVTLTQSPTPALCQGGTFARTWVASDLSGNSDVFTQTIVIYKDTLPPTVTGDPQNGSSSCTQVAAAFPAWLAAQMVNFKATDPSGVASYSNNAPGSITGNCPAPVTVTFQATDSCGYAVTRTATFTTLDTHGPDVVTAPRDSVVACSPPAGNHLAALGDWIHRRARLVAKDSCSADALLTYSMKINGVLRDSAQVVAAFLDSLTHGCQSKQIGSQLYPQVRGVVRVDFLATDACGNTALMGHADFGAIDTVAPVITGNPLTEECGGGNDSTLLVSWINNHGNATVTDDCSGYTWTGFSWTSLTGQTGSGSFGSGPYPAIPHNNCNWYVDVAFRATDDCGNTGTSTLRFRIKDTTPPVFTGLKPVDTLYCPTLTPPKPVANVSDNCDNNVAITSNFQVINQFCSDAFDMLVTWIATDDCGNTKTATQTFMVRDTTHPVITKIPADVTIRCDTFALPPAPVLGQDVVATDNCGDIMGLIYNDVSNQNPNPALCGHYSYTIVRTFTVADDCGNTATRKQTITVLDNIPPVISGFLDTVAVCETQPVMPPPTATDICSGIASAPVLQDNVITSGSCPDSYTITLSWASTDVCGNTGYFSQNILIVDTLKPTLTGVPGDVTVECNAVPPLPNTGIITGHDNCDEDVDIVFTQTEIRDPNPANCAHWANYMIIRQWTVTDNCGNSNSYSQTISVQDNTGPAIVAADTVSLPAALGLCGANTIVPSLLSVFDDCTSSKSVIILKDTVVFTPSGMPVDQFPVDTVVFSWSAPNTPPMVPAVGTASLAIALDNADSEQPSESFEIYGEDGYHIGRTKLTNIACGFSGDTIFTLPTALLNAWLADGQLDITLAPNGQGPFACNAYCTGGRARATLIYSVATQEIPLTITYSIDNGAQQAYPAAGSTFLDAGNHVVVYTASDCAGNSSTASTVVRIEDKESPIVTPPSNMTTYVSGADCLSNVALPFPTLQENCGFSGNLNLSSLLTPVQFELDPNAGWVPKNITLSISGAVPNAVTGGTLTIRHLGDNGDFGEFFKVLDEQDSSLSTTTNSTTGECAVAHESVISVSAAKINAWAADGVVHVKLLANRDVVNFTDFISFCQPLDANNFDGVSKVQALLDYNLAVVQYEIKKDTQTVQTGQLSGSQTMVSLPPGQYTVYYRVNDSSGNLGATSFALTVRDTIAPVAKCKPITIFTNPTGMVNDTLQPQVINNNSVDNCSGTNLSFQLSQTVFTCNMAALPNNIYPVTLTVSDTSGNSSQCATTVQVRTANCLPTVTPSVCEGANVQLFANPPAPANGYSGYLWNGPNAFVSMAPNPNIPNASSINEGTYGVTVTGQTGCTSVGTVLLDLSTLPTQPKFKADVPSLICEGANLTLSCEPYGGNDVMYFWYSGTPANPTLLGTTNITSITLTAPPVGTQQYFVKVTADGCTSVPSDVKSITVQKRPVAIVNTHLISVCPCSPIALGTSVQGAPGVITYLWTGPAGFAPSTLQNPLIPCAQEINEGNYVLVVFENGCASAPDTSRVDVRAKPAKPEISGITAVCQGDSVLLNCFNVPTAAEYHWISPLTTDTVTNINKLLIPNVSLADSGSWRLQIVQNNCLSDLSDPKLVQVQAFPNISATSNSPICQGAPLQLSANSTNNLVTFKWSNATNFFAIGANVTDMNPKSGNYIVTVSTGFNCTNTAAVPVTVVVPPNISSVTNTAPACTDCATNAVLQATIITQYAPLTYVWTGPGGFHSTLPEPLIPGVCTDDNGTYNLIVKDSVGCPSNQASTEINVQAQPMRPALSADTSYCAGSMFSISVLNPSAYGSNISFEWHTPNGILIQSQSKLTIPVSGPQHSGDYWLVAKAGDCTSSPSDPVHITIHPIPPAPTPTSNSPVCEGAALSLSMDSIPGATYAWTGPVGSGFTSSIKDPVVPQATEAYEGCYSVVVTANGCASAPGLTCTEVKTRPKTPKIEAIEPICLDDPGAVLTLRVLPDTSSATPMAQYTWFNAQTFQALAPPTFALTYQLTNLSTLKPGANSFYVEASLNGCTTASLLPVTVVLDTIPPGSAFAGLDFDACNSMPFQLNAQKPTLSSVTGTWTQLGTPPLEIVDPFSATTQVRNAVAGQTYRFVYALSSGACKNYSRDTVQVTVFAQEKAMATADIKTCSQDSIILVATQGTSTAGYWLQPPGQKQQQPPVFITDSLSPVTVVRNLPGPNAYYFMWVLNVPGCGMSIDTVNVFTYGAKPNAGKDQNLCGNDYCTVLTAKPDLKIFESGKWTRLGDTIPVGNNPYNVTNTVCNLKIGENIFEWKINDSLCGDRSRDTVIVNFHLEPSTTPDTVFVPFGEKRTVNALLNDIVPPEYTVEVLEAPAYGQWEQIAPGQYSYLPSLTFSGEDLLTYNLCNLDPSCACKMGQVVFVVGQATACKIPNIITPNGDQANDVFVIPPQCLLNPEGPPDNEVTIFNQWGDLVFHQKNYQNDWGGTYNNDRLPAGTYYYVIKLPAEDKPRTGYLLIQW